MNEKAEVSKSAILDKHMRILHGEIWTVCNEEGVSLILWTRCDCCHNDARMAGVGQEVHACPQRGSRMLPCGEWSDHGDFSESPAAAPRDPRTCDVSVRHPPAHKCMQTYLQSQLSVSISNVAEQPISPKVFHLHRGLERLSLVRFNYFLSFVCVEFKIKIVCSQSKQMWVLKIRCQDENS